MITIKAQLHQAIRRKDPNMTAAQRTASELASLWNLVQEYHVDLICAVDGQAQEASTAALRVSIDSLGRAISREKDRSMVSLARRAIRAMTKRTQSPSEECHAEILATLQQFQDSFDRCIDVWTTVWSPRAIHGPLSALGDGDGSGPFGPIDTYYAQYLRNQSPIRTST